MWGLSVSGETFDTQDLRGRLVSADDIDRRPGWPGPALVTTPSVFYCNHYINLPISLKRYPPPHWLDTSGLNSLFKYMLAPDHCQQLQLMN